MVNDEVEWLGQKMQELLDAYPQNRQSQPLTFNEVEELWEETVKPALKDFKTMQNSGEPPPENSQWFRQWRIP